MASGLTNPDGGDLVAANTRHLQLQSGSAQEAAPHTAMTLCHCNVDGISSSCHQALHLKHEAAMKTGGQGEVPSLPKTVKIAPRFWKESTWELVLGTHACHLRVLTCPRPKKGRLNRTSQIEASPGRKRVCPWPFICSTATTEERTL